MPRGTSVSAFVTNLVERLAQLEKLSSTQSNSGVWLGHLFQPEAYVTASRQTIAHQKGWSLEQLVLSVEIEEADGLESFKVEGKRCVPVREGWLLTITPGLKLEGASWIKNRLSLNDGQTVSLSTSQLTWRKQEENDKVRAKKSMVNLPLYLNSDRSDVLFSIDVETDGVSEAVVAQRGACLTAA